MKYRTVIEYELSDYESLWNIITNLVHTTHF